MPKMKFIRLGECCSLSHTPDPNRYTYQHVTSSYLNEIFPLSKTFHPHLLLATVKILTLNLKRVFLYFIHH